MPSRKSFVAIAITALAGVVLTAAVYYSTRGRLSCRKRRNSLSYQTWRSFFTQDGRLKDGGIHFLKKVRSGGVESKIRAEVWPFLLGVYDLSSSQEERDIIRTENRREYEKIREQCHQNLEFGSEIDDYSDARVVYDSYSDSEDPDVSQTFLSTENRDRNDTNMSITEDSTEFQSKINKTEEFATWQRIIRLDAVRANPEWIQYAPSQADIQEFRAHRCAEAVGLKDYDHLEPSMILHAARLVAILEAYAIYDPETGYCQGMTDLLSPIITVMTEDHEAFWCFVEFMKKARHNFRLDEVGIRRQLNIVSKIIKYKDSHLYKHLEKLQAEDCFFVYRMVLVLFRRELTFEQTLCLWEVIWADQAAIRAGFGKSALSSSRLRSIPPTEDLLLYAIASSVLQRRKRIIEKYNSMDEILRECNSMAGHVHVWKLLDDAHSLVVTLHDKM